MNLGSIVVLLALVAAAACAEPLEFADWTIPIPEGVRVVEYPATPAEDRTGRIELAEDLVLGRDESDPNQVFYRLRDVDVDSDGNLWVLDGGNHRIQVFDREGRFVRSLGREGQGPGELESPGGLAIVGDRLVVRAARLRLILFDLDGVYVDDVLVDSTSRPLGNFVGLTDGTFLASYTESPIPADGLVTSGFFSVPFTVSNFGLDATELHQRVQVMGMSLVVTSNSEKRPASIPSPFPSFSVSDEGDLYVTEATEYQVHAFDPDAEPKWSLRVAHVPEALSDDHIERAIESARRRRPETTYNDLIWRKRLPALSHVAVDGHGHVYVYPYFERGETLEERPVDVYSADGELLFAGMILDRRWRRAQGDFVYAAGADRVTGESLVWRWRLDEPF